MDVFNEHVLTTFDIEAVVLVPDSTVVDPNIVPGDIEAVCVESRDIVKVVRVKLASSCVDVAVSDFKSIDIASCESPVRRVVQENVLEDDI